MDNQRCLCDIVSTRERVELLGNVCDRCEGIIVVPEPTYEAPVESGNRERPREHEARVIRDEGVSRGEDHDCDDNPEVGEGLGNAYAREEERGEAFRAGLPLDLWRDAVIGATRRQKELPRMELPKFSGAKGANPQHYFLKIRGYFVAYNVVNPVEKGRLIAQSLDGEALDLFLSLSIAQQTNIEELEEVFEAHFRPIAHRYLGIAEFMKLRKGPRETVSEFYLKLILLHT